ncbi:MAG: hypothetical protein R3E09_13910 [Novosphingobium sp.]
MNSTAKVHAIACKMCGLELIEAGSQERSPCPRCRSIARSFEATIRETITLRDSLVVRAKRAGAKGEHKYFVEEKSGWSLHHETGEWRYIEQVVDRENHRYRKRVTGQDGTVFRDVNEPLSAHRERGDAKKRK